MAARRQCVLPLLGTATLDTGVNADTLPAVEAHWLTEFGLVPLELPLCRPTFQRVARRHHDLPCLRVPHR